MVLLVFSWSDSEGRGNFGNLLNLLRIVNDDSDASSLSAEPSYSFVFLKFNICF